MRAWVCACVRVCLKTLQKARIHDDNSLKNICHVSIESKLNKIYRAYLPYMYFYFVLDNRLQSEDVAIFFLFYDSPFPVQAYV